MGEAQVVFAGMIVPVVVRRMMGDFVHRFDSDVTAVP